MAAGLEVFGDSGVIQITQDYKNLFFSQKFTQANVTITQNLQINTLLTPQNEVPGGVFVSGRNSYIDIIAVNPIIAIHLPSAGSGTLTGVQVVSLQNIGTNAWRVWIVFNTGCQFTGFVYDTPPTGSGIAGLQVFKTNGELAFDSNRNAMIVSSSNLFESGGRKFAYVSTAYGFYQVDWEESGSEDDDGYSAHMQLFSRGSSAQIVETTCPVYFITNGGSDITYNMLPYYYMAGIFIDVTRVI